MCTGPLALLSFVPPYWLQLVTLALLRTMMQLASLSLLIFTCRLKYQRQWRSRLWLPLASSSPTEAPTPTPTPSENEDDTGARSAEAAVGVGNGDVAVGSGGRLAGGTFKSGAANQTQPGLGWGAGDETESKNSKETSYGSGSHRRRGMGVKNSADGRIRVKWGLDVDVRVRVSFALVGDFTAAAGAASDLFCFFSLHVALHGPLVLQCLTRRTHCSGGIETGWSCGIDSPPRFKCCKSLILGVSGADGARRAGEGAVGPSRRSVEETA